MARFVGTLTPDTGSLRNEHVSDTTDIDADKLEHLNKPGTHFGFVIGGTPTTREEIVYVASTAGNIRGFHCLLNDSGTSTDIDFDLKVNGVSVLSAAANIVHGTGDGVVVDGSLTTTPTALAVDDIVSIAMTVTSSTGAQGPYAWAEIQETAAAA